MSPSEPPASDGRGRRWPTEEAAWVGAAGSVWVGVDLGPDRLPLPEIRWALAVAAVALLVTAAAVVALTRALRSSGRSTGLRLVCSAVLVGVGGGVAGAVVGSAAAAAYRQVEAGPIDLVAEVVADPEQIQGGQRLELRLPTGHRVLARAYGPAGWEVGEAVVGDLVAVRGVVRPAGDSPWLRSRHITGIATLDAVEGAGRRGGISGLALNAANVVRSRIAGGAATMGDRQRALYLGLVIGDDRRQPLGQRLRFQAAGLTHLLAVSGQNVAFAVAVAAPALRLFGRRTRFAALIAVLILFALVTRLEPSVLRATTTAGLSAWAALSGRERTGLAALSAAVVGLILIDPFLVDVVGFQLSVAASAGILVFGPAIEARLRGPGWFRSPASVTIAAQLAVTPLLSAYFGPVSVAAVPANLLAGWAAAGVMTIGLTLGVVVGLLPDVIGSVGQAPAMMLVWWIESVAEIFAALPAPQLGIGSMAAGLVFLAVGRVGVGRRADASRRITRLRRVAVGAVLVLLVTVTLPRPPSIATPCGQGLDWYPGTGSGPSVLVVTAEATARGLDRCRSAGVSRVDLVVAERGTATSAELVAGAREIFRVSAIAAPPLHRIIGGRRQLKPASVRVAGGSLVVAPDDDRTRLRITFRPDAG